MVMHDSTFHTFIPKQCNFSKKIPRFLKTQDISPNIAEIPSLVETNSLEMRILVLLARGW